MSSPGIAMLRALALLLVLVSLFHWKLIFSDRFTFLDSPDLTGQVLPWYNVEARAWNQGVFPMWDPYVWGGQPLLGQMQPGGAFPLNWPLFAAPLNEQGRISFRSVDLHFGLMHVLAALFMYAFVRDQGRSRYAALLAGMAFSCGGYLAGVGWPQMLHGAVWIPLIFLCFLRAVRAASNGAGACWAILAGGAVGMALLSGHHQTPTFTLFALGGFFLNELWQGEGGRKRLIALFVLTGVAAFLTGGLQLLPAYEYGKDAYRWVSAPDPVGFEDKVPYFVHEDRRLYPITLMGLVIPRAHFQTNTFVGWVCLFLALYAVAACWKDRFVRVLASMAVLGLLYGFASFSPLHGWFYQFAPLAEKARDGAHAVLVFHFAVFALAAWGIDRLFQAGAENDPSRHWLKIAIRILLTFAAVTWFLLYLQVNEGRMEAAPGDQMMLSALAALGLAGLLAALQRGALNRAAFGVALFALAYAEIYAAQTPLVSDIADPNRRQNLDRFEEYRDVMDRLASFNGRFRFELVPDGAAVSIGAWHGVEQVDGFLASVNRDVYEFLGDVGWVEGRLLLNTVYTVAKEPQRDVQVEIYEAPNGWKIFLNPDASPRVWLEHSLAHITNAAGGKEGLQAVRPCDGEGRAHFVRWTIHRALIETDVPCPSYLVLADPYWPGWGAEVNGEAVPIRRYRNALRAVEVPGGTSTVQFLYRPGSVYWGGSLTALGLLLCGTAGAALLWLRRRESGQ